MSSAPGNPGDGAPDAAGPDAPADSESTAPARAAAHGPSIAVFLITAIVVLTADLWAKAWSFEHVAGVPVILTRANSGNSDFWRDYPHEPIVVIPHVLSMRLTTNTGAVFGLGKGGQWVFVAVSIAAVFVLMRIFLRSPARAYAMHVTMALIMAGAIGNLYDRVRFNAVRDMFWLFPDTPLWPWIFNIADAALMIGVGGLVVILWVHDRRRQNARSTQG